MPLMISSLFVLMLVSCTNDKTTPADAAKADATSADATSADAGSIDATINVCTGQLYDACNPASPNCITGTTCKTFTGSNFSVCTQACGTCPNQARTRSRATRWAPASRMRQTLAHRPEPKSSHSLVNHPRSASSPT